MTIEELPKFFKKLEKELRIINDGFRVTSECYKNRCVIRIPLNSCEVWGMGLDFKTWTESNFTDENAKEIAQDIANRLKIFLENCNE